MIDKQRCDICGNELDPVTRQSDGQWWCGDCLEAEKAANARRRQGCAGKAKAPSRQPKPAQEPIEWASDVQVARIYAISRPTVWRWVREKRIPKPHKLGPNCTRWKLSEVREALEGKAGK